MRLQCGRAPWARLFQQTVQQADEGCDFDFMVPGRRT
jgi:hypothetical protein